MTTLPLAVLPQTESCPRSRTVRTQWMVFGVDRQGELTEVVSGRILRRPRHQKPVAFEAGSRRSEAGERDCSWITKVLPWPGSPVGLLGVPGSGVLAHRALLRLFGQPIPEVRTWRPTADSRFRQRSESLDAFVV